MKVNTELSHDAEYIGNIQENRVGIDKSNIDFIATLLTSNLYSKPLESFLRETVSNAYDSHVEAGTDEYILLVIEDLPSYHDYRISIRDYGVGVSPERFDKIYRNIGSSTKRESNDYIGMFGIGRFSCLSCADVANITSFYNGKKYSYVMYKNGGGINIDKLSETSGDFKNGLEVSIKKSIYNSNDIVQAIFRLCLFDKLHIVYKGTSGIITNVVNNFNERKIYKFNNFTTCTLLDSYGHYSNYFRVGNVLYDANNKLDNIRSRSIIVDLPIGSVDITPNRESLQFTDYTVNTIITQEANVKTEFQKIFNDFISGDMTLPQFCKSYVFDNRIDIKTPQCILSLASEDISFDSSIITIDKEPIPENYEAFLHELKWWGIPKEVIYKNITVSSYSRSFNRNFKFLLVDDFRIAEKKDVTTKQVTMQHFLDYAKTTNKNTTVLVYDGLNELKKKIIDTCDDIQVKGTIDIKECVDFTFKHLNIAVLDNNKVPQSFIDSYKAEQRNKRQGKKVADDSTIPIRIYCPNFYGMDSNYRIGTLDVTMKDHGAVIYSQNTKDNHDILRNLADIAAWSNSLSQVITLKTEDIPALQNNKMFIKLEDFIFYKNNILTKLITCWVIRNNFFNAVNNKTHLLDKIPIYTEFKNKYKKELYVLYRISSECEKYLEELRDYYIKQEWVNKFDINYFSLSENEIKGLTGWITLAENHSQIIQMVAFQKYGKLPKIGLTRINTPKI